MNDSMDTSFQSFDKTFHDLPIAPKILEVLDKSGFRHPSHIQAQAIPLALSGKDIFGIAQTGTGKTLAFTIPMIQQLTNNPGRGLILSPTRELATQIYQTFVKIGEPLGFHTAILIGGESFDEQLNQLNGNARVIIATPGRLLDHLRQQTTRLDDVIVAVLDEADRMLDMGFIPNVELILKYIAKERQIMMFSATMPDAIMQIADKHMTDPQKIEISPESTTNNNITQQMYIVSQAKKNILLEKVLAEHKEQNNSTLVFCRKKIDAAKLTRYLKAKNFKTAEIHADKTQEQRFMALEAFKKGSVRILVATDVAARGIDVKNIGLVINYDLPDDPASYVHRIGRTGRAGKTGIAISFASPEQINLVKDIEKIIKTPLPLLQHPEMAQEYFISPKKLVHEKKKRFNKHR